MSTVGGLFRITSDQSFSGGQVIEWDEAAWQSTPNWWASSPNPSRVTVPSGVTRVRVTGMLSKTNQALDMSLYSAIRKNGANLDPRIANISHYDGGFVTRCVNIPESYVIDVSPGDYFELYASVTSAAAATAESSLRGTWLSIRDATSAESVVVKPASTPPTQNFWDTTPLAVQWGQTVRDDHSGFSVSNNTRLTVPAGATKARLRTQLEFTLDNHGGAWCEIRKNGTDRVGWYAATRKAGSIHFDNNIIHCMTPVIDVTAGDYFEVLARVPREGNSTGDRTESLRDDSTSWFEMELFD